MQLPFVEGFGHSLKTRKASDSVIVRVETTDGTVGYGEGAPRPYVTGESVASMVEVIQSRVWPALTGVALPDGRSQDLLAQVDALLPALPLNAQDEADGVVAHHAARAAVEVALIDACLKRAERSLGDVLTPTGQPLCYSGVITSESVERALGNGRRMKSIGLQSIKAKVGFDGDVALIAALRDLFGADVSIRVDANGVWSPDQALHTLTAMAEYHVDSCEEPLGRASMDALPDLAAQSPIPIMVDESLCTLDDARRLGETQGCHLFNVRVSKCGGLYRAMQFIEVARAHGIRFQIGSHVGETSILAAAGRHLAASLPDMAFLEGSYGTILLSVDVTRQSVRFGHRGSAPLLKGPGLGIRVLDDRLNEFAPNVVSLTA